MPINTPEYLLTLYSEACKNYIRYQIDISLKLFGFQ